MQPSYEKGQQKSLSKSRSPGGVGASSSRGAKYYESSQKSHSKSRSPRSSRNKYYDFVIQIFLGARGGPNWAHEDWGQARMRHIIS